MISVNSHVLYVLQCIDMMITIGAYSGVSTVCMLCMFIIKFQYNARSDWLKQRALSEYRCTE